ncbi:MAG TPA: hypothetical protein VK775_14050 [Chthoniobacterales bacterium]|nr:hypothetical protein [Chthoniobacterales bacterium]
MSSVSTTKICGTDNDFNRPSGTGLCIDTQALRAWLRSACPSGTKAYNAEAADFRTDNRQLTLTTSSRTLL